MSTLDPDSLAWMRTHHATIPDHRLLDASMTFDQRRTLVSAGVLARVVDGAYTFGGVVPDEPARCAALCASRSHLVVAGPTAGRLWELRRSPRDGLVHVIAPPASQPCREPWVRPYRTKLLYADEVVMRPDGIRLTTPTRTIVDLTRYVVPLALASIIEHGLSRQLTSIAALYRCAERLNTPGRPWVRRFLRVLAARHPTAAAQSDAELRLFDVLVERGVVGLERQVRADLPGYGTAYFDLAVTELRWAIEVDLHPTHRSLEGRAKDIRRDDGAEAVGWRVRRVSELDLAPDHFERTVDALLRALQRRRDEVTALTAAGQWRPTPVR